MHEMREKKTENLSQSIGMHGHYELYYFSSLFLFIFSSHLTAVYGF